MSDPEAVSTLGLLTYSRNDIEGVLRNVRLLRPMVTEVVVLDSSLPDQRSALLRELRPPAERVYPVPHLGIGDLLRPFGLAKCSTDRVLQLDSDEVPSPELLGHLPGLRDAEAYIVPRREGGTRGYTHHMRLVRRERVEYRGPCYAYPVVRGRTEVLPHRLHIEHNAPLGRRYWAEADRRRRYLLADLLERPYDRRYFRRTVGVGSPAGSVGPNRRTSLPESSISDVAANFAIRAEAVRAFLVTGSVGIARMRLEQGRERIAFWSRLTAEQRAWVTGTAIRVREAGGLVRFLGLDDSEYVERLDRVFDPTVDAPGLLLFLLHARSESGRPWEGSMLPPELSSPPVEDAVGVDGS